LQPSFADLWLKPNPLSNELLIVTALGQWSPLQMENRASMPEMEALHSQKTFSKPIHAKEERNGPPSANQGLSQQSLDQSNYAISAQCWNPPTILCPTLSAGAEPKSWGNCWKWHHKLKIVWLIYACLYSGFTTPCRIKSLNCKAWTVTKIVNSAINRLLSTSWDFELMNKRWGCALFSVKYAVVLCKKPDEWMICLLPGAHNEKEHLT